jgi:hypothetical protein
MKFKKAPLFLSMALAASMMAVPAMAADVSGAGGTGETPVTITAQATTFSVTVPTSIPLTVKADGTVGVPTDLKIVNKSAGKVKVIAVTAKDGTWTLTDYAGGRAKLASEKVDAKKLGLQLTAAGASVATTGTNAISSVDSTKWVMDGMESGKNELPITVAAIATAVSKEGTFADANAAAKVIFTIGWDTQTGTQDVLSQATQDVLSELA